jgi:hypothetical protein
MPFDLQSIERGYGEVDVEWQGHTILCRYRADLNNRALIAMGEVMVGVPSLDGATRFPNVKAIIDEVRRVLLPSGPDVPEDERGWDLTDGGVSVPITFDTLVDLPPGLPATILGAIVRDVNSDPNSRRPFKPISSRGAVSPPIESRIIGASSSVPNATDSTPSTSPTPIDSIRPAAPSSQPPTTTHGVGYAGLSGTGS